MSAIQAPGAASAGVPVRRGGGSGLDRRLALTYWIGILILDLVWR
jgi:hypothetical protein